MKWKWVPRARPLSSVTVATSQRKILYNPGIVYGPGRLWSVWFLLISLGHMPWVWLMWSLIFVIPMWVTGNWRDTNGKYNEQSPGMYPQRIWVVCYDERWVLWQTSIFRHETCVVSLTNTSYHQKGNSIDQAQSLTQISFLLLFHNCESQP